MSKLNTIWWRALLHRCSSFANCCLGFAILNQDRKGFQNPAICRTTLQMLNSGNSVKILISVIVLLLTNSVYGQIKNTGLPITLTDGAVIAASGNWVNDANSTLNNNGTIITADDFVNNGAYAPSSTGGFVLTNVTPKTFTTNTATLAKLELDSQGGLNSGSLTITDSLTLTKGIITLASTNVLTLEATAKVAGGNSESYVDGKMIRKGTGDLLFPTGKAAAYLPITFYNVAGTAPQITVALDNAPSFTAGDGVEALIGFPYGWTTSSLSALDTASFVEISYPSTLPTAANPIVVRQTAGQLKFESMGAKEFSNANGTATVRSYVPGLRGLFSVAKGLSANFDPASLNASAITDVAFTANWNAIPDATSYLLDVSTDNFANFLTGYNAKQVTALTQAVTGLSPVTTYQFRVRATNGLVVSPNSVIVSVATKASQVINFAALANKKFGDAAFDLTAIGGASSLPVTFASSNPLVATVAGATVTIVGAGITTITASQAGNAAYNTAADVSRVLTVNKADQTIIFANLPTKKFGDATFSVTATGGASSLPVIFASSNTAVSTISGNTVTIVGAGTTTITASQAGNANYNAAADVPQVLTVNKADQLITFGSIAARTLGTDATIALGAISSAPLALTYSTTSDKVTISGGIANILKAGSVTISADQSGNGNFNAAPRVSQSFCINPAKPTISLASGNTETPTLTSSASSGNQWYKEGIAISGATNSTLSVTAAGIYSVETLVDICKSARSSDFPVIVTGDISRINKLLEVSPNPSSDFVTIKLPGEGKKEIGLFSINGGLQESKTTDQEQLTLDVRQYSAGYYLIRVATPIEIYYGKFIKK